MVSCISYDLYRKFEPVFENIGYEKIPVLNLCNSIFSKIKGTK